MQDIFISSSLLPIPNNITIKLLGYFLQQITFVFQRNISCLVLIKDQTRIYKKSVEAAFAQNVRKTCEVWIIPFYVKSG